MVAGIEPYQLRNHALAHSDMPHMRAFAMIYLNLPLKLINTQLLLPMSYTILVD